MKFLSIAAALLPIVSGLVLPRTLSEVSQSLSLRADDPCRIVSNVTVVSGDTLTKIANTTGSTVDAIVFVNPNITNPDYIYVGEVINIPATECNDVAPSLSDTTAATATCATVGTASTYTVASGDTLTIIAARFGITLDALVAANPQIEDIDVIDISEVINIPVCSS